MVFLRDLTFFLLPAEAGQVHIGCVNEIPSVPSRETTREAARRKGHLKRNEGC